MSKRPRFAKRLKSVQVACFLYGVRRGVWNSTEKPTIPEICAALLALHPDTVPPFERGTTKVLHAFANALHLEIPSMQTRFTFQHGGLARR